MIIQSAANWAQEEFGDTELGGCMTVNNSFFAKE